MTVLPIITLPDPLLRKASKPVERVDAELRRLADDMLAAMYAAQGYTVVATDYLDEVFRSARGLIGHAYARRTDEEILRAADNHRRHHHLICDVKWH